MASRTKQDAASTGKDRCKGPDNLPSWTVSIERGILRVVSSSSDLGGTSAEISVYEGNSEIGSAPFVPVPGGSVRAEVSLNTIRASQNPVVLDVMVPGKPEMTEQVILHDLESVLAGAGNRIDSVRLITTSPRAASFEALVRRFCFLPLKLELLVNGARVGIAESITSSFQPEVGQNCALHEITVSSKRAIEPGDRITLVNCFERRKIVFEGVTGHREVAFQGLEALSKRIDTLEVGLARLRSDLGARTGTSATKAVNERLEMINRLLSERLDGALKTLLKNSPASPGVHLNKVPHDDMLRSVSLEAVDGIGVLPLETVGSADGRWLDRWVTLMLRDIGSAQRVRLVLDEFGSSVPHEVRASVNGTDLPVEIIKTLKEGRVYLSLDLRSVPWGGGTVLLSLVFQSHWSGEQTQGRQVACCLRAVEALS